METSFSSRPAQSRPTKGALGFIFTVVLLDIIGLTILQPVQAFIVRQYDSNALAVSMLTVIYAAAQFVFAPILGRLSDRHGRRPVLLISLLGSAFGYYLFGIGGALWVLFLSRLIDGITGGNISTASAYVADVTPPQDRARNFALIGIAFGLGFVFGPTLGGALSQISLQAPAYAAGTLSLLSAIVGFFVLPESLPQEQRTAGVFQWREVNPLATLLDMIRRPALRMLLLVWCLFQFAFTGHTSILAVFVIDRFGMSPVQLAFLFVLGGIANAIVQGGLVGRLASRFGEKRLALASLGLQALTAIALVAAPVFWLLYPIMVLNSAATALIWPTMGALMANQVPLPEQGQISGASTALGSLMSVFGPLWAGAIYDQLAPVAPYWSSMLVFALAALALAGVQVGNRGTAPAVQSSDH